MRFASGFLFALMCAPLFAAAPPKLAFDRESPAEAQVPVLHEAWAKERGPARRKEIGQELVEAVIHEYVKQEPEIVAEVARNGLPQKVVLFTGTPQKVTLGQVNALGGVHADPDGYPRSPIFRRIAANRIEAWTPMEGWLFDGEGKVLSHVQVPRRDGTGRDWFGAFLPDGNWITTDLWSDDKQLNGFSPKGEWKWELKGSDILKVAPKPLPTDFDQTIRPSIGWARADKTGKRWIANLGTEFGRAIAYVKPDGKARKFPEDASMWREVYPRSMGVRGFYIDLFIGSDDAKETMSRGEAGHGVEVGWPRYDWLKNSEVIVPEGTDNFGFWPGSHDVFIEARGPETQTSNHVWFFDAKGKYESEVTGSRLADAANGKDLLVQAADDSVLQVTRAKGVLAITGARQFTWPDGTVAIPLAIYDDLKLGFFQRGAGMSGTTDDARRARGAADIVLASWKE